MVKRGVSIGKVIKKLNLYYLLSMTKLEKKDPNIGYSTPDEIYKIENES